MLDDDDADDDHFVGLNFCDFNARYGIRFKGCRLLPDAASAKRPFIICVLAMLLSC